MKITVSVFGRFHAFNLAEQLFKQDVLNKLITSYPKFEVIKYGIPKGKVISMPFLEFINRSWNRLSFLRDIYDMQYIFSELYDRRAASNINEADIVTGWTFSFLHTLRKAKSMGAITIVERGSSHILYQMNILQEEYERYGIKPRLARPKLIEKELLEYEEADFISIPSLFVKRTFLSKGFPEEKLIHVPYGVDLDSFRQIPKEDKTFRVIYCGSMTLQKGVHYLLQVFSELKLTNSELLLVGSLTDEMKPFFKKYEGNFKWVGHIPQQELYRYYSQGSVFALMSIQEGLALVQPQAMACGLPIICTTNTGGEDIVRDRVDGFIIPIRDVNALKEKLAYMYENQDICKQMGQNAKERVSKGFTWDDYGERMVRIYKKVLHEKSI